MPITTPVGCMVFNDNDDMYCPEHCPDQQNCDELHFAIFSTNEVSCYRDTCSVCGQEIDEQVVHYFGPLGMDDICLYCEISKDSLF